MLRCLRVALMMPVAWGQLFSAEAHQAEDRSNTLNRDTCHIYYPDNSRSGSQPGCGGLKFFPDTRQLNTVRVEQFLETSHWEIGSKCISDR